MRRVLTVLLLALPLSFTELSAQRVEKSAYTSSELSNHSISLITWTTVRMDSTYNPAPGEKLKTLEVLAKYKPEVDKFNEPIGFCPTGLERKSPCGPMSCWATDAFLEYARNFADTSRIIKFPDSLKVDFSLMNFGGMRTEMPKGNVSKYDILSIFPFDNYLTYVQLNGRKLKELIEFFCRTYPQAMSAGVRLVVDGYRVKECTVNGKPIEDDKNYVIATIDFLVDGGDNLYVMKEADWVIRTEVKLMDLFISYIEGLTARGANIEAFVDERCKVVNRRK
ncbi:MAG: 5'-nucleotidase C-terminal domain-containing protein [Bacteroidales bacterium]|nr:5'-nucleotidase C-terminal domain-containing protein [Bacteroidales bacterium]